MAKVDMPDYPNNSHRAKEKAIAESAHNVKKVEKVISGNARVKQKSELRKFTDLFISEDASSLKEKLIFDVLVPSITGMLSDFFHTGIDTVFGKGSSRRRSSSDRFKADYVSYDKISYNRRDERSRRDSQVKNARHYNEIYLDTKGEAEEVLSRMDEMLDMYQVVSIADLYDLVGITHDYTDCKYGWTDLSSAMSVRTREGDYLLKLPRAVPID